MRVIACAGALLSAALLTHCGDPTSPDTQAPSLSLTASPSSLEASGPVMLTAVANDNVGVAEVQFWKGGTLLFTDATPPHTHSVVFTPDDNGSHTFSAIAVDGAHNHGTSNAVTVVVAIPTLPRIEDFGDGSIDRTKWVITGDTARGLRVEETNGRLEIFIPGSVRTGTFVAAFETRCKVTGDFDVEVDYRLLSWPSDNGAIVSLAMREWHTQRLSGAGGPFPREESYGVSHYGSVRMIPTSDTEGTLRVARVGASVSSYYRDGSDWVLIQESSDFTAAADVLRVSMWGVEGSWANQDARVALDNFRIVRGTSSNCER